MWSLFQSLLLGGPWLSFLHMRVSFLWGVPFSWEVFLGGTLGHLLHLSGSWVSGGPPTAPRPSAASFVGGSLSARLPGHLRAPKESCGAEWYLVMLRLTGARLLQITHPTLSAEMGLGRAAAGRCPMSGCTRQSSLTLHRLQALHSSVLLPRAPSPFTTASSFLSFIGRGSVDGGPNRMNLGLSLVSKMLNYTC